MRPPTETRVAAVITALLAAGRAIDGVACLDGPENNTTDLQEVLAIGVGDEAVIVSQQKLPGYGEGYKESLSVVCGISVWTGGDDTESPFGPMRARAVAILKELRDLVAEDTTLGGACNLALLGQDQVWWQGIEGEGWAVKVGFSILATTMT